MFSTPALGGDITLFEATAATALFAAGYTIHEALHAAALELLEVDYTIEVLPTNDGQSRLTALFMGRIVEMELHGQPSRRAVTIVSLAPLIQALVPLTAWAYALTFPVLDVGTALALAVWAAASIPSPGDLAAIVRYQPDAAAAAEVTTHG